MGLFSKLFSQKQPDSRQTQEQRAIPPKMTHWAGLNEEDAFEDQYGAKIDRLQEKIDDATWVESDNPADQIKAYEKALELCDQLEDFCAECGPYGSTYFLNHCAGIKPPIEAAYRTYMERDYPQQKAEWDKEQAKKKAFAAKKRKILKFASEHDGVMRKEIYALFAEEEQAEVLKALNALIQDGKMTKQMDGKRLLFYGAKK